MVLNKFCVEGFRDSTNSNWQKMSADFQPFELSGHEAHHRCAILCASLCAASAAELCFVTILLQLVCAAS